MRVWMIEKSRCTAALWLMLLGITLGGIWGRMPESRPVMSYVTAGSVVVIDAGHGGPDAGAIGVKGTAEKDISLALSEKLARALTQQGCIVICTRSGDEDLVKEDFSGNLLERKRADLQARADIANRNRAALFISVHLNADPSPRWSGAQTFYEAGSPAAELVGKAIQQQLQATLKNTRREALAAEEYFLMSATEMPAVFVEAGFLSNPKEEALLQDEAYQQQLAAAVARGITDGLKAAAGEEKRMLQPDQTQAEDRAIVRSARGGTRQQRIRQILAAAGITAGQELRHTGGVVLKTKRVHHTVGEQ